MCKEKMNLEQLLGYILDDNRVCPKIHKWIDLCKFVGDRNALPFSGPDWFTTSDIEKQERLAVHIRLAAKNGRLEVIENFIRSWPPNDWVYKGEVGLF